MLGNVILLHFGKAFGVVLFSWRVDDRVLEVIELFPLFGLWECWLVSGKDCLVGTLEIELDSAVTSLAIVAVGHRLMTLPGVEEDRRERGS